MKKCITLHRFSTLKEIEDLQAITAIRINNYYSISNWGSQLKHCINVEEVYLTRGFIAPETPFFIKYFTQLRTLVLEDIPIDSLLPFLGKLSHLKRLELKNNTLLLFQALCYNCPT
ncbi:MAG: hypothetical protein ACRBFS_16035 [Aureispira sp.]